jgi:N-acetylglutamate synthase-like GNAT family acetyltransferase
MTSASTSPNSASSIRIRIATAHDIAAMIPIVNAAFAVETFIDGTRTDEERMAGMMRTGEFLLAENASGHIVGCVYTEIRGDRGYFGMLAVDPSRQGIGLGKVIVEAAENHCRSRGCVAMDICVLSLRTDLPPFYRKLGYSETGTEEFAPSRPLNGCAECHSIIFSKPL